MITRWFELPVKWLTKINFFDKLTRSSTNAIKDPNHSMESQSTPENEFLLQSLRPETSAPKLPDFDYGEKTKRACILGVAIVWLVIVTCIVVGIICIVEGTHSACLYPTGLSIGGGDALSFGVNALLTLCIEALGYIHGTSLRWGLFREGCLQFNTNIRLFRCTRRQPQNGLLANTMCTISLILCYAASSQLFVYGEFWLEGQPHPVSGSYVNGIALLTLALGLSVKATISTWIMVSASNSILTWNSNPFSNVLAAIHHGLEPRPKRCMISVHQAELPSTAIRPLEKQQSGKDSNRTIRYIVLFAWALPILALTLFTVLVVLSKRAFGESWHFSFSWIEIDNGTTPAALNTVVFHMPPNIGPASILILGVLLLCAIQGTQTLSLHTIELIVNISRDEEVWRSAVSKKTGAQLKSDAFTSASFSWQTITLFIAKALLHWLLGQTVSISFRQFSYIPDSSFFYNWYLMYIRAFAYTIGSLTLAGFTTFLAYRKPKGPQPAAFGHLQTLADLIDDWTVDEKGCFWWGDKGIKEDGVRHAGTRSSWKDLGQIHLDALYAG